MKISIVISSAQAPQVINFVDMCPEVIAGEAKTALTEKQRVSHFENVEKLGRKSSTITCAL